MSSLKKVENRPTDRGGGGRITKAHAMSVSQMHQPVRLAYQPPVLLSHNKQPPSNQPAVLFS
jgi:hypothetical protein